MQEALFPEDRETIYTVTELTRDIKFQLEDHFAQVHVVGEISNFRHYPSGHFYLTLKDETAQISAVMFKGQNRNLKFKPEDGLEVLATGRVTVYEPRGQMQLVIDVLEPKGLGALQLAFEQLKNKLRDEGLFSEEIKKPLPLLPQTVGIITSPAGAAIRDLIHILHRRHPAANILLYPVLVQGDEAPGQIAAAIQEMNGLEEIDVLIVGRGGGSLEDLWAFNTEEVARAIVASHIPVVSAVGHETDVTISDFVADLRAPTPSTAAELVVPVVADLRLDLQEKLSLLQRNIRHIFENKANRLNFLKSHLKHPRRRIEELAQHLDDLAHRLNFAMDRTLSESRSHWQHLVEKLEVLSPLSILSRGYSIVNRLGPDGSTSSILKSAKEAKTGDKLSIRLMKGRIKAQVL